MEEAPGERSGSDAVKRRRLAVERRGQRRDGCIGKGQDVSGQHGTQRGLGERHCIAVRRGPGLFWIENPRETMSIGDEPKVVGAGGIRENGWRDDVQNGFARGGSERPTRLRMFTDRRRVIVVHIEHGAISADGGVFSRLRRIVHVDAAEIIDDGSYSVVNGHEPLHGQPMLLTGRHASGRQLAWIYVLRQPRCANPPSEVEDVIAVDRFEEELRAGLGQHGRADRWDVARIKGSKAPRKRAGRNARCRKQYRAATRHDRNGDDVDGRSNGSLSGRREGWQGGDEQREDGQHTSAGVKIGGHTTSFPDVNGGTDAARLTRHTWTDWNGWKRASALSQRLTGLPSVGAGRAGFGKAHRRSPG